MVPLCDHVPDWQPRILLGMVEARSVNVKNTTTTTGRFHFSKAAHNLLSCNPPIDRNFFETLLITPVHGQHSRQYKLKFVPKHIVLNGLGSLEAARTFVAI